VNECRVVETTLRLDLPRRIDDARREERMVKRVVARRSAQVDAVPRVGHQHRRRINRARHVHRHVVVFLLAETFVAELRVDRGHRGRRDEVIDSLPSSAFTDYVSASAVRDVDSWWNVICGWKKKHKKVANFARFRSELTGI
jgi:hypothetical protein